MNLISFSDRLQAAMDAEGIMQADLARQVGVTRAAINQVLSGASKGLKPENLVAVRAPCGYGLNGWRRAKSRCGLKS